MTEHEELEKLRTIIRHALAEKNGLYFICGEAGERGQDGLPERVLICPAYGLSGFAVYTKTSAYSEPGF